MLTLFIPSEKSKTTLILFILSWSNTIDFLSLSAVHHRAGLGNIIGVIGFCFRLCLEPAFGLAHHESDRVGFVLCRFVWIEFELNASSSPRPWGGSWRKCLWVFLWLAWLPLLILRFISLWSLCFQRYSVIFNPTFVEEVGSTKKNENIWRYESF